MALGKTPQENPNPFRVSTANSYQSGTLALVRCCRWTEANANNTALRREHWQNVFTTPAKRTAHHVNILLNSLTVGAEIVLLFHHQHVAIIQHLKFNYELDFHIF